MATALASGSGCVARPEWIERTLVTVDVTGVWYGVGEQVGILVELYLQLEQRGPKVKGSVRGRGANYEFEGPIDGSVTGDVFSFTQTNGPSSGELTVGRDEMAGRVRGAYRDVPIVIRRVSPVSRPDHPSSP